MSGDNGGLRRLQPVPLSTRRRRRVDPILPTLEIPRGAITIFCGWQGIGKGTISSDVAARVTRAGHGVAIVSDEDSLEATILPRLQAADADLDRVHTYDPVDPEDAGGVLLPRDLAEIRADVAELDLWLLLLDPWTNHMDVASVDRGDVRRPLMELARMCRDTLLAAILTAHPNRRTDTDDPLAQIAHAGAVSQVARAVFFVTLDPDEGSSSPKENPHRLLIHGKANMTRIGDTRRFELTPTLLLADDGQPEVETVRAVEVGTSPIADYPTARARLRQLDKPSTSAEDSDQARCVEWLAGYLADGGRRKADVLADAQLEGNWSQRTIERAGHRLGVKRQRPPGAPASVPVEWVLPAGFASGPGCGETGETGETVATGETGSPSPFDAVARGGTAFDLDKQPVATVSPVSPTVSHPESWRDDDEELVW